MLSLRVFRKQGSCIDFGNTDFRTCFLPISIWKLSAGLGGLLGFRNKKYLDFLNQVMYSVFESSNGLHLNFQICFLYPYKQVCELVASYTR